MRYRLGSFVLAKVGCTLLFGSAVLDRAYVGVKRSGGSRVPVECFLDGSRHITDASALRDDADLVAVVMGKQMVFLAWVFL